MTELDQSMGDGRGIKYKNNGQGLELKLGPAHTQHPHGQPEPTASGVVRCGDLDSHLTPVLDTARV